MGEAAHTPRPERVWTGTYGNVVTASPRLACEMKALGDTLVEYVLAERLREAEADIERLRTTLTHVINRVSTEGRDDEHGHIFTVGKAALNRTKAPSRETAAR